MLREAFAIIGIFGAMFMLGAVGSVEAAERHSAVTEQCSAEQGQMFIDDGRYDRAIREFECVIAAQPTEVDGYRGRIEAELLLGRYSDAVRDYQRVTAFVVPVHADAQQIILAGYDARLAI